ncbi:shikimate dehydrogenase [Alicyclobacillus sp. SO9]|uniref:shikimate dehydrogenase family protein n=1 Tax=Alicyclobacillus sp. SO9 TaxID=2665646 RepID=UPI0018E7AA12|nr:shikimate dehydrogenase [Alicyclobacillus sp. SO9]QQE77362.1 shikimate dehydrogenase [Alicyclobacillus sp. SO9]
MAPKLFGLLGWPVGHSASPVMMAAAFKALQLDAVYLPFPLAPDRFEVGLNGLAALGAVGVNVTIPHKQAAWKSVSEVSQAAALAKAVNTIRFETDSNVRIGHNTDVEGWWQSVHPHLQDPISEVVLFGSGGAARAVLAALSIHQPQVKVYVLARNPQSAQALSQDFCKTIEVTPKSWDDRERWVAQSSLVVNATSVGMWPNSHQSVLPDGTQAFHSGQVVQDAVYRPRKTRFLQQAEKMGAQTVDGLHMLVGQGAAALEYWLRSPAPADVMMAAAKSFLDDEV